MKSVCIVAATTLALFAVAGQAQQKKVELMASGTPVAPIGLQDQPLGKGPFAYHTAEQQDVRVTVFARGLEYPYSIAFLPTGELYGYSRPREIGRAHV